MPEIRTCPRCDSVVPTSLLMARSQQRNFSTLCAECFKEEHPEFYSATKDEKDFQPINLGAIKDDSSKPFCLICRESIENPINSHGPVLVKGVEGTICLKCARSSKANEVQYLWQKNVATKNDTSKPRYDLLPPEALEEIVKVLTFGASKYGDRNWEKGLSYSRCFAAMMRHLWAWWRREDLDPESGLSHLAHAGCCVLFLLTYQLRSVGQDDRPIKG